MLILPRPNFTASRSEWLTVPWFSDWKCTFFKDLRDALLGLQQEKSLFLQHANNIIEKASWITNKMKIKYYIKKGVQSAPNWHQDHAELSP